MTKVRAVLLAVMMQVYRPRLQQNAWQWAESDRNIYLRPTTESQNYSGPYRSDLTPHTRILMEFATDQYSENVEMPAGSSDTWDEIFIMKSSQSGFTLAALVVITYFAANRPCNIIYTIDSVPEARRISKTRLQPMLMDCPATAERIKEAGDDLQNLTFYLRGLTVYFMGSYSPGAMANKSAGLVIADELDNHDEQPQGEANSIDLLRDRLKRVIGGKLIAFSKPKTDTDITNQEYLTGTRHKCFVPCPHCGHYQELVWENVRYQHCKNDKGEWDLTRVLKETYYECEHADCRRAITEEQKPWMMERHRWRPTNHGQDDHKPVPRKLSVHISDLYSILHPTTWGYLASKRIAAENSISKKKAFITGNLGLPWTEKRSEVKEADIWQMCGQYQHGHCPRVPRVVLMASDVQADVKKWTKVGLMANGDCYVISYGVCLSYDELLTVADEPVIIDDWGDTPEDDRVNPTVLFGLIDEGHDQKSVRDFCQRSDERFYPVKGRGGIQVRDIVEEKTNFTHNDEPIVAYFFSDDDFKAELYLNRILKYKKVCLDRKLGRENPVPLLQFPYKSDPEFISELCQEKRVQKMKAGRLRWVWDDPEAANDFGDALKMCLVAWYLVSQFFQQPEE